MTTTSANFLGNVLDYFLCGKVYSWSRVSSAAREPEKLKLEWLFCQTFEFPIIADSMFPKLGLQGPYKSGLFHGCKLSTPILSTTASSHKGSVWKGECYTRENLRTAYSDAGALWTIHQELIFSKSCPRNLRKGLCPSLWLGDRRMC